MKKVVNYAAMADPFIAYAAADLIKGYNLSAEDLKGLDLPEALVEEDNLIAFYEEYFQFNSER